jgi:hypothetical protein
VVAIPVTLADLHLARVVHDGGPSLAVESVKTPEPSFVRSVLRFPRSSHQTRSRCRRRRCHGPRRRGLDVADALPPRNWCSGSRRGGTVQIAGDVLIHHGPVHPHQHRTPPSALGITSSGRMSAGAAQHAVASASATLPLASRPGSRGSLLGGARVGGAVPRPGFVAARAPTPMSSPCSAPRRPAASPPQDSSLPAPASARAALFFATAPGLRLPAPARAPSVRLHFILRRLRRLRPPSPRSMPHHSWSSPRAPRRGRRAGGRGDDRVGLSSSIPERSCPGPHRAERHHPALERAGPARARAVGAGLLGTRPHLDYEAAA